MRAASASRTRPAPPARTPRGIHLIAQLIALSSPSHASPFVSFPPGGIKAELDVFVGKGGLRLVKTDGKVLGAFPLQRIQQWGIPSPGVFKLSVQNGDKVVALVVHGDADEIVAIVDALERKVAQIIEDTRAVEEGRAPMDVSSPPPRAAPASPPRSPRPAFAAASETSTEEDDDVGRDEVVDDVGRTSDDDAPKPMDADEVSDEVAGGGVGSSSPRRSSAWGEQEPARDDDDDDDDDAPPPPPPPGAAAAVSPPIPAAARMPASPGALAAVSAAAAGEINALKRDIAAAEEELSRERETREEAQRALFKANAEVRSVHWSPYDPVREVDADP